MKSYPRLRRVALPLSLVLMGAGCSPSTSAPPATGGSAAAGGSAALEWLPSWATTIQTTEPKNEPPMALANSSLRQFVWPTVSGQRIRLQLSNEKGTTPVEIQKVHISKAKVAADPGDSNGQIDTATTMAFSFSEAASVTIPPGETVWSDPLSFPLEEIRLTTISMQLGTSVPRSLTGHPGARTTSYITSGDAVDAETMPGAQTIDRWYFINAIEVMARADAFAIAVLGDSITDGYGVLNEFARWPDYLTVEIQDDPEIAGTRSVLNFGMGANNLTVSDQYQDSGLVRFERDVLGRDKVKWLIVLEGINDIEYSNVQAAPIIAAYQEIIRKAKTKGILVYGSTITPNGEAGVRATVNDWIRTSNEFDEVIDLDAAIREQNNIAAAYRRSDGDSLHPSTAGYEAMGKAVDLSLFY